MAYFCNLHIVRGDTKKQTSFYSEAFHSFPTRSIVIGSSVNADIIVKELEPEHIDIYFQKNAMFMKAKTNVQINTRSMRDVFVSGVMRIPFSSRSPDMFKWQVKVTPYLYISGQIHKANIPKFSLEKGLYKKYGKLLKICEKEYISYRLSTTYIIQVPAPNCENHDEKVAVSQERKNANCQFFTYVKHINEKDKFIISEYFEGCTLENHKAQNGIISPKESCIIIKSIAQYLQEIGTLFVSLTPDNIRINHQDETKLTGISKKITGKYHYYAPPENLLLKMGQDVTGNIYTLGVLFFELVTGCVLFSSIEEYKLAIQENKKTHLNALSENNKIPEKISKLIEKMTSFKSNERISYIELMQELINLSKKQMVIKPTLFEKLEEQEKTTIRSSSPLQNSIQQISDDPVSLVSNAKNTKSFQRIIDKPIQTSVRQAPNIKKTKAFDKIADNSLQTTVRQAPDIKRTKSFEQIIDKPMQTEVRQAPNFEKVPETKKTIFSDLYKEIEEGLTTKDDKSRKARHQNATSFIHSNQQESDAKFNKQFKYFIVGFFAFCFLILCLLVYPFSSDLKTKKKKVFKKIVHKKTSILNHQKRRNESRFKIVVTRDEIEFLTALQKDLLKAKIPSQKNLNVILKKIAKNIDKYSDTSISGDIYNITARIYFYKIELNKQEKLFEPFWVSQWKKEIKKNIESAIHSYNEKNVLAQLKLILMPWMPERKYLKKTTIFYRNNKEAINDINTWVKKLSIY